MNNLISRRVKSFILSAISMIGLAIAGVLISPEFESLIVDHFGNSATVTVILLILQEVPKHIYNKNQIKKLGGEDGAELL